MKVYVLAAGYATRLHPLTRNAAKPLLDIGGLPLLTRILRRVLAIPDVREIVVISNARFAEDFRSWAHSFESPVPVRILDDGTRDDATKLGAIGDLAFALREVPVDDEEWLVVAGDNLVEFDLRPAAERFRQGHTPHILVRKTVRPAEGGPSRYNEVDVDGRGRVTRFREKPTAPKSNLAAIALYLFPAAVAARVFEYLEEGGNPDAPGHFLAWLVDREPVTASPIDGEWHDIGNLETLATARARFAIDDH